MDLQNNVNELITLRTSGQGDEQLPSLTER